MNFPALTGTLALTAAAAAQQYTPVDIGTLTQRSSLLAAINARGAAAGASAVSGDTSGEPWVLHAIEFSDGGLRDLGVLGPDVPAGVFPKPESRAFSINRHGQVVGRSSQPGEAFQAFLWLPEPAYGLNEGMHPLPDLGELGTQAYGINDLGQIAGESRPPASIGPRPVRWDFDAAAGGFIISDLGDLGGPYGRASAINGLGQSVGQSNIPAGDLRAFLHLPAPAYGMPAGMNELLPSIPFSSYALDINDKGQVVGVAGVMTPFVWLPEPAFGRAAGAHLLPVAPIPDAVGATAHGINNRGEIVGDLAVQVLIGPPPGRPALRWHGCVWRDLQPTLLDELVPAGWRVIAAGDINDAGQIAATGVGPGFELAHGLLLKLTCPADLTGEGVLDFFDFLAFQDLFGAEDPKADCDTSGDLSVFDFLCYQNLFAAGCP